MHKLQSIMHSAFLKVMVTRTSLTRVWHSQQMETFCYIRMNLTAIARLCSTSLEWYPRPVPGRWLFTPKSNSWNVTGSCAWPQSWAGCFSRLPVGGMTVFHSPPGTDENHSENHTEENAYLKQIWLPSDIRFFIE